MILNLPNLVTLSRLMLVFPLVFCFEAGLNRWALVLFLLASGTDWLDGYLARRLGQTTALGAMLDPLVDKVLVTAALLALASRNLVPAWSVTLILSREFLITGLRSAAAEEGISIPASIWGKAKTLVQVTAIALFLLPAPSLAFPLYWVAVGLTVFSGGEYVYRTRAIWLTKK